MALDAVHGIVGTKPAIDREGKYGAQEANCSRCRAITASDARKAVQAGLDRRRRLAFRHSIAEFLNVAA